MILNHYNFTIFFSTDSLLCVLACFSMMLIQHVLNCSIAGADHKIPRVHFKAVGNFNQQKTFLKTFFTQINESFTKIVVTLMKEFRPPLEDSQHFLAWITALTCFTHNWNEILLHFQRSLEITITCYKHIWFLKRKRQLFINWNWIQINIIWKRIRLLYAEDSWKRCEKFSTFLIQFQMFKI